jgi:hypothetical protein
MGEFLLLYFTGTHGANSPLKAALLKVLLLYTTIVSSYLCFVLGSGSLTENVSAIVAGDARPHGKVTYILAGVSVFFLLLTACWATLIIRHVLPPWCQDIADS